MPGLPPSTPYDPVETVLNFARTIANDCALSISGNLLADTQPYIYPMLNLAWRKLQDRLGNNAVEDFPEEIILTGITPVPSTVTDPAIQCYINFQGYFDGINLNTSPVLPQDLEEPLKIYERPSGQNAQFSPMFSAEGGISASHVRGASFGVFEWRDDTLYLVGATQLNDLRIRYLRKMSDIASGNATTTPIPILKCAVALAYLVVEIFSASRGGTVTQAFSIEKENAIKQLINTTTRKKQRTNFRRKPYSRRGILY